MCRFTLSGRRTCEMVDASRPTLDPNLVPHFVHEHPQFGLRRDPESSKSFQEPQPVSSHRRWIIGSACRRCPIRTRPSRRRPSTAHFEPFTAKCRCRSKIASLCPYVIGTSDRHPSHLKLLTLSRSPSGRSSCSSVDIGTSSSCHAGHLTGASSLLARRAIPARLRPRACSKRCSTGP